MIYCPHFMHLNNINDSFACLLKCSLTSRLTQYIWYRKTLGMVNNDDKMKQTIKFQAFFHFLIIYLIEHWVVKTGSSHHELSFKCLYKWKILYFVYISYTVHTVCTYLDNSPSEFSFSFSCGLWWRSFDITKLCMGDDFVCYSVFIYTADFVFGGGNTGTVGFWMPPKFGIKFQSRCA